MRPRRSLAFLPPVILVALGIVLPAHAAYLPQTLTIERTVLGAATAPCPAGAVGVQATDRCLYALGGQTTGGTVVHTVEYEDPQSASAWTVMNNNMTSTRAALGAVEAPCPVTSGASAGKPCLYALGGTSDGSTALNSVEYRDPSTGLGGNWTLLTTNMSAPRTYFGAAAAPCPSAVVGTPETTTCIYAYGGYPTLATAEYYNPSTNMWGPLTSLHTGRGMLGGTAAPCPATTPGTPATTTCVYAIGGYNAYGAGSQPLTTMEYYDPTSGPAGGWTVLPGPITPRALQGDVAAPCPGTAGTVGAQQCLWAIGGDTSTFFTTSTASVEYWDPSGGTGATNTWQNSFHNLQQAREVLGSTTGPCPTTGGTTLVCSYAIGGFDASTSTPLNTVEYFDSNNTTAARVSAFSAQRVGTSVVFTWHAPEGHGLAGFRVAAGGRALSPLLRVHRAAAYRYTAEHARPGPYTLQVVMRDGRTETVRG